MKSGGAITAWAAALLLLGQEARAFDAHKMKKCADNGFCKRHRAYAASPAASPEARGGGYAADESTLVVDGDGARVIVASHRHGVPLELRLSAQPGALIARLRLRELAPLYPRFEPPTVLIESAAASATTFALASRDAAGATMTLGGAEGGSVRLEFAPLRVRFYAPDGAELATFNARGLLEYEHYRAKPAADEPVAAAAAAAADGAPADAEGEGGAAGEEGTGADEAATDAEPSTPDAEGAGQAAVDAANEGAANDVAHAEEPLTWSESFQSHHDTRPRGPSSIGIDVTLNGFAHVYGLPERATSLNLKDTR
jgi:alpha 1,3-glucosidase